MYITFTLNESNLRAISRVIKTTRQTKEDEDEIIPLEFPPPVSLSHSESECEDDDSSSSLHGIVLFIVRTTHYKYTNNATAQ